MSEMPPNTRVNSLSFLCKIIMVNKHAMKKRFKYEVKFCHHYKFSSVRFNPILPARYLEL